MAVTVVGGYTYVSTGTITQPYVTEVACNVTTALVEKPVKIQQKMFATISTPILRDFRFPPRCEWDIRSSRMLRGVVS